MEIKKSKKAEGNFLGEHAVNIIVAVICIVMLIALGVIIYNNFIANKIKLEQAQSTLDQIMNKISLLKNEGDNESLLIYNPAGWALSYQDSMIAGERPAVCQTHKCLCICLYSSDKKTLFANCDNTNTGICKIQDVNLDINSKNIGLGIGEYDSKVIKITSSPQEIELIQKTKSNIEIQNYNA